MTKVIITGDTAIDNYQYEYGPEMSGGQGVKLRPLGRPLLSNHLK